MIVRDFFEIALPEIIKAQQRLFDAVDGSICIVVNGVAGWTVRFGDHTSELALTETMDLDADLIATWSEPSFTKLIQESYGDVSEVTPIVIGDEKLLRRFATLLQPAARGGLGAQLAKF